jgi:hypothetical protein
MVETRWQPKMTHAFNHAKAGQKVWFLGQVLITLGHFIMV